MGPAASDDGDAVERQLSTDERAMVMKLASPGLLAGRLLGALPAQLASARARSASGCPVVDIVVDETIALTRWPGALPDHGLVRDAAGRVVWQVLVWIRDGRLSRLEYRWLGDSVATALPRPEEVEVAGWDWQYAPDWDDALVAPLEDFVVELAGARISLASRLRGWASSVDQLASDVALGPAAWDFEGYGAWGSMRTEIDYGVILRNRDRLEQTLERATASQRELARDLLAPVDTRFMGMTEPDGDGALRLVATELGFGVGRGWWWSRVPVDGPVRRALRKLRVPAVEQAHQPDSRHLH